MLVPKEPGVCPGSDFCFYTPSENARRMLYYLVSCGHYYTNHEYRICRGDIGSCVIFYICSGQLTVRCQDVGQTARPGQVVFLNCHLPHEYYGSAEFIWLHLDGVNTQQLWDGVCREHGGFVFDTPCADEIRRRIYEVIYACRNEQLPHEMLLSEMLYALLIACLMSRTEEADPTSDDPIQASMQFIRKHYHLDLTLEDMARQGSMSKYHFSRLFKKHCGYSPHEFLTLTRLNRAKHLLKTTDLPIKQIAQEVGYQSVASFTNTFTGRVGVTPSRFRQYPV